MYASPARLAPARRRMIRYSTTETITVGQFRDILVRSTLGERRPLDSEDTLDAMLTNASLLATAWDGEAGGHRPVGDGFCLLLLHLRPQRSMRRASGRVSAGSSSR